MHEIVTTFLYHVTVTAAFCFTRSIARKIVPIAVVLLYNSAEPPMHCRVRFITQWYKHSAN